jgi:hypothetical protein
MFHGNWVVRRQEIEEKDDSFCSYHEASHIMG